MSISFRDALDAPLGLDLDERGVPREPVVLIDSDATDPDTLDQAAQRLRGTLAVRIVVARGRPIAPQLLACADLAITDLGRGQRTVEVPDPVSEAHKVAARIEAAPRAAIALAWLLRATIELDVPAGIAAESAAYSMLLAGSEFAAWRAARPPARPLDMGPRVRLAREGDRLRITLTRAGRRNAMDTQMRQAWLDALRIAEYDPAVRVEIDAEGPSFCAGGDLDEFGSASDVSTAHLVRVAGSVGQLLHDLAGRVTVRVHGAGIGAGIELPAFAARIVATPDATFGLPEVAMGLIPGAGGTVSIPRRIGRDRAFWLAVTNKRIDVRTARAWGLVDEIV